MTTYDALPYEDYAHPEATPDHLAAVAWMLGHPAAPPTRARVLEIGCATGSHLLPLAEAFPEATWVGIDVSAAQIAEATTARDALGLGKVALHACSFADLDEAFQGFDYVLCHGVFSWIARDLQGPLLRAVKACLGPEGVGFVSYNTQPGWCAGERLREYLQMHGDAAAAPGVQIARARVALELLLATAGDSAVAQALRAEARRALDADPGYFFHEYLEAEHHPLYLQAFAAAAESAGLALLGDAHLPRNTLDALDRPERLRLEQTADFLHARRFRTALLVQGDRPPARRPDPAVCAALRWSTRFALAADAPVATLRGEQPLSFSDGTRTVTLHAPLEKCTLATLAEAEGTSVPLGELCDAVADRLGLVGLRGEGPWFAAESGLVAMAFAGLVLPHGLAPRYADHASARPTASAWARHQASRGPVVTTRRHQQITLDAFAREMVQRLDGTRGRVELYAELAAYCPGGEVALRCEETLEMLARNAVLIG